MKSHSSRLAHLESLVADGQFSEAESWIEEELLHHPSDPDLHSWLAQLMLWSQRELVALEHLALAAGGAQFSRAVQDCANYLYCRAQMAWKLKINDIQGSEALAQLAEISDVVAEEGVGLGITACLIIKDEAQFLDGCLESLKGVVDEIVIVDTGSTDDSLKIAEKYGAKIGKFQWRDDFSAARNASLELATQPWILWIDADERLEPDCARILREAVMRPQFGGFMLGIVNEVAAGEYFHSAIRLFRNHPKIRFEGRIHEQIVPSLDQLRLKTADLENARIRHLGYKPEIMVSRGKVERTLAYVERETDENPNNPFHWFNLANALATRGNYEGTETAARRSIELMDQRYGFSWSVYHLLVASLYAQGKMAEAVKAASEAEEANYDSVLSEYERSRSYFALGDLNNALKYAEKCCEMEWQKDLCGDYSVFKHRRWCLKARLLAQLNQFDPALRALEVALNNAPQAWEAKELKSLVFGCQSKFPEALAELDGVPETTELLKHKYRLLISYGLSVTDEVVALTQFSQAVTLIPQEPLGWLCSGDALYKIGRFSDAASQYQTGLRIDPTQPEAWFCYGNALAQIGADEAALEAYAKCINLKPDHEAAKQNAKSLVDQAA